MACEITLKIVSINHDYSTKSMTERNETRDRSVSHFAYAPIAYIFLDSGEILTPNETLSEHPVFVSHLSHLL